VRTLSLADDNPTAVAVVTGQSSIYDMVVGAEDLFWLDVDFMANTAQLRRAARDGSDLQTLDDLGADFWGELALDDRVLYLSSEAAGTVTARPIDDTTAVTTVVSDFGLAEALAVAGGYVYWSSYGGALNRTPVGGGATQILQSGVNVVVGIAVDDTYVYWSDLANGTVARMPLGEQGAVEILADSQAEAGRVVLDERYVYWQTAQGIVRMTK
jgi:hypothetical protein